MPSDDTRRQLLGSFIEEVDARSRELERNLLSLETAKDEAAKEILLKALLRTAHSLKGAAGLLEVRPIETACHWMEEFFAAARQDQARLGRPQIGLLLEVTDAIDEFGRLMRTEGERADHRSAALLLGLSEHLRAETGESGKRKNKLAWERRSAYADAEPVEAAVPTRDFGAGDSEAVVRVAAERLDAIMLRSGELLGSRKRMQAHADQAAALQETLLKMRRRDLANAFSYPSVRGALATAFPPMELLDTLEDGLEALTRALADESRLLERTTSFLEGELQHARMQSFSQACDGLDRLVRDLATEQGKSAELVIRGGGTELDRAIVAPLRDVLRHLVRNAIGHGLERPEERAGRNKPERGRIVVAAATRGDRLEISVEDDGRGIDLDALRACAGLPETASDEELVRLVFLPGITTSPAVTRLSGRGMGLEIVKSAVERLRGSVTAQSRPGNGSLFVLAMPLTLAASRAVLLSSGGQLFALESTSALYLFRVKLDELHSIEGRAYVSHEGRSLPVVDLAAWLGRPRPLVLGEGARVPLVVFRSAGREAALLIEDVAGEQELLVRALGPRLAKLNIFSGAALLPDGAVALVVNAAALMEAVTTQQGRRGDIVLQQVPPAAAKRILVVDDSPTVRMLEKIILERAGYEVLVAADGEEAWKLLATRGADALVADVDMPRMDGFALTEAVRSSERFKNLPVILVTSREDAEDTERGLEAGADAYMVKSTFDQDQLLELTRQMLKEH
jgi:two-component system, chemotaxis family, sensor kinase CheA